MNTGKVKFYNETKGFGFIIADENGEEIFFHVSGTVQDVKQNDKVTFDTQDGKKGKNAVNVTLAN